MWAADEKLIINKLMKACTYDKSYIPLFLFVEAPEVVKVTSYIGVKQIPMHTAGIWDVYEKTCMSPKHVCFMHFLACFVFACSGSCQTCQGWKAEMLVTWRGLIIEGGRQFYMHQSITWHMWTWQEKKAVLFSAFSACLYWTVHHFVQSQLPRVEIFAVDKFSCFSLVGLYSWN